MFRYREYKKIMALLLAGVMLLTSPVTGMPVQAAGETPAPAEEAPAEAEQPAGETPVPAEEVPAEAEQPAGETPAPAEEVPAEAEQPAEETPVPAPKTPAEPEQPAEEAPAPAEEEEAVTEESEETGESVTEDALAADPQAEFIDDGFACEDHYVKWEITRDAVNGLTLTLYGTRSGVGITNRVTKYPENTIGPSSPYWEEYRTQIETVVIGQDVHEIHKEVFADHPQLRQVIFEERNNTQIKNRLELGERVFSACPNLREITLPRFISSITGNPFKNSGVTVVHTENEYYPVEDGILYGYEWNGTSSAWECATVLWCSPLRTGKTYEAPETLRQIGEDAFYNNTLLEEVILPEGFLKIGASAFEGCVNLRKVNWPASIEYISSHAFYNCEKLEEVRLTDNLYELGYYAFAGCKSLKELTIPGTLTSPSGMSTVAAECDNLETLRFEANAHLVYFGERTHTAVITAKTLVLPVNLKKIYWGRHRVERIVFMGSRETWEEIGKEMDTEALAEIPVTFLDEAETYTVSFDANGGEGEMEPVSVPRDTPVKLPPVTFTRKGYHFTDWRVGREVISYRGLEDQAEVYNPGTCTLFANWGKNVFTVEFDANGATGLSWPTMSDVTAVPYYTYYTDFPGESAARRAGYRFTGWNTRPDGTGIRAADSGDLLEIGAHGAVITLYAQWEPTGEYPVYYHYSKRTNPQFNLENPIRLENDETVNPMLFRPETGLPRLPELHSENKKYIFEGWYADTAFKKKVESIAPGTTGEVHLYAKISAKPYTVTFDGNASGKLYDPLTGGLTEETAPEKVTGTISAVRGYYDTALRLPENKFSRKGYIFAGYAVLDGDEVRARFSAGEEVEADAYLDIDAEGNAGPLTLYALWMKGGNLITLDAGKEGFFDLTSLAGIREYLTEESVSALEALGPDDSISVLKLFLPSGKTVTKNNMPKITRDCHTFKGWYSDETYKKQVKSLTVSGKNGIVTLYAKTVGNKGVVKFTKGGPGKVRGSMKPIKVTGKSTVTLPECAFTNDPIYLFDHWELVWEGAPKEKYYFRNEVTIAPETNGQVFEIRAVWKTISDNWISIDAGLDPENESGWKSAFPDGLTWGVYKGTTAFRHEYGKTLTAPVKLPVKLEKTIDGTVYLLDHWEAYQHFEYFLDYMKTGIAGRRVACIPKNLLYRETVYRAVWERKEPLKGEIYYAKDNLPDAETVAAQYQDNRPGTPYAVLRTKPVQTKSGLGLAGWSRGQVYAPSLAEGFVAGLPGEEYLAPGAEAEVSAEAEQNVFYPVFASRFEAVLDPGEGAFGSESGIPVSGRRRAYTLVFEYNKGCDAAEMKKYIPEREGYAFDGWQYTDYNGKVKTVKSIPKNLNRPVKLTAQWKVKSSRVRFYANIPKDDPLYKQVKGSMKPIRVLYGAEYKMPETKFKIKGYTFDRWSYTPCDYRTAELAVKGPVPSFGYVPPQEWQKIGYQPEIRLYAVWKKDSYRITFEGDADDPRNGWTEWPQGYLVPRTYHVDTPTLQLHAPYRQGYQFLGWYKDEKLTKKITQIRKGSTGDLTLYPKWKKLAGAKLPAPSATGMAALSAEETSAEDAEAVTDEAALQAEEALNADAEGAEILAKGYCNPARTVVWELTEDETPGGNGMTLRIYGIGSAAKNNMMTGATSYYYDPEAAPAEVPWEDYRDVIETVVIGQDVHYIMDAAFSHHPALRQVVFEDREAGQKNRMSFGLRVFAGCPQLTQVELPWYIDSVSDNPFTDSGVTTVTVAEPPDPETFMHIFMEDGVLYNHYAGRCGVLWYPKDKTDSSFTASEKTTHILGYAFYENTHVTSVILPESTVSIGAGAFYGCKNLQTLTWPEGLREILESAFEGCEKLTAVRLTDSLKKLVGYAFLGCRSLKELTIPGSLDDTRVYWTSVAECDGLETLTLGSGIGEFGNPYWQETVTGPVTRTKTLVLPVTLQKLNWTPLIQAEKIIFMGTEAAWEAVEKWDPKKVLPDIPVEFIGGEENYVVSFDANGGEGEMEAVVFEKDVPQQLPKATFTRKYHYFTGWGRGRSSQSNTLIPDEQVLTNPGTRTLYAQWSANRITIVFDGNGATGGSMHSQTHYATGLTSGFGESKYTKEGYTFDGWNTAPDGSGISATCVGDVAELVGNEEVITLYAQWKETGYRIYYSYNRRQYPEFSMLALFGPGGEKLDHTRYMPGTGLKALPELYSANKKYTFDGWYADAAYKTKVTEIKEGTTGDVYLYAKITPISYTISFDGNAEGKLYDPLTGTLTEETSDVKVTGTMKSVTAVCDTPVKIPANRFARKGCIFAGFAVLDGDSILALYPAGTQAFPDEFLTFDLWHKAQPLTLTALWMTGGNRITFEAGEGAFDPATLTGITPYLTAESRAALEAAGEGEEIKTLTVFLPAGKKVAAKDMPKTVREAHTFKGWYTDPAYKKQVKSLSVSGKAGVSTLYARTDINRAVIKFTKGAPGKISGSIPQVKITGETFYQLPGFGIFRNEAGYEQKRWKLTWLPEGENLYLPANTVRIVPERDGQVFEVQATWEPLSRMLRIRVPLEGDDFFEKYFPGVEWDEPYSSPSDKFYTYVYKTTFPKNVKLPVNVKCSNESMDYVLDHWVLYDWNADRESGKKVTYLACDYTSHKVLEAVWRRRVPKKGYLYYAFENGGVPYTGTNGIDYCYEYKDGKLEGTMRVAFQDKMKEPAQIRLRTAPAKTKKGYALVGWRRMFEHQPSLEEDYVARIPAYTYHGEFGDPEYFNLPGQTVTALAGDVYYPVFAKRFEAVLDPAGGAFGAETPGLTGESTNPVKLVYEYNKGVSKEEMTAYIPEREGYAFGGWQYTDYKGKTKTITGALPKTLNRPVRLTALWKPLTVKIVFHHNIPEDSPLYQQVKGSMKTLRVPYGQDEQKLPRISYRIAGYSFSRWSDKPCNSFSTVATVNGRDIQDGSRLPMPKDGAYQPEIHLYATWSKITYRITYAGQDKDPLKGWTSWFEGYTPPNSYTVDTGTITLRAPYRQGYQFLGWYKDEKLKKRITQIRKGSTGNLTLYPKWKKMY